ncbi:MAG: hypothetical protein M1479_08705 [Actinobacteria bacterium]|nr:hypothetical protein [Actinomycetota bacterium]
MKPFKGYKYSIILLLVLCFIFTISCSTTDINTFTVETNTVEDNANIEAENRYLSETNGILNGIKVVYLDFQNSVNDYNQDKRTCEKFIKSTSNKGMISEMKAFADCVKTSNGYSAAATAELNKLKGGETTATQTIAEEKGIETGSTIIIKYNIIYTVNNARFEGGTRYYLLTKPIDLSNGDFKDGIKGIVTRFVKIHGNKVSLNIYDKLETLENDYKETEDSNITASTDPEYLKDIELHFIACYDGDLSAGLYLNTLGFFPAYYEDIPEIEQYLEILEFNP